MTFAAWYDSTIVPQLNETLKNVPVQAREPLRTASRQTMAACWNAALDAVHAECGIWSESSGGGFDIKICRNLEKVLRA